MKSIPPLIYGTAWKKEKTEKLVVKAISLGFRGIDTACQPKHYDEVGIGTALQTLYKQGIERESIFLQTKFTPLSGHNENIPYDPESPIEDQIRQSFETSLKNLRVHFIDSFLLHSPLSSYEETMVAWKVMEDLHQQSLVGRIGISNCYSLDELQNIYCGSLR